MFCGCFGDVLGMFWVCFGHVLGMFWVCVGHVAHAAADLAKASHHHLVSPRSPFGLLRVFTIVPWEESAWTVHLLNGAVVVAAHLQVYSHWWSCNAWDVEDEAEEVKDAQVWLLS